MESGIEMGQGLRGTSSMFWSLPVTVLDLGVPSGRNGLANSDLIVLFGKIAEAHPEGTIIGSYKPNSLLHRFCPQW
jgi:hypothetical protein